MTGVVTCRCSSRSSSRSTRSTSRRCDSPPPRLSGFSRRLSCSGVAAARRARRRVGRRGAHLHRLARDVSEAPLAVACPRARRRPGRRPDAHTWRGLSAAAKGVLGRVCASLAPGCRRDVLARPAMIEPSVGSVEPSTMFYWEVPPGVRDSLLSRRPPGTYTGYARAD